MPIAPRKRLVIHAEGAGAVGNLREKFGVVPGEIGALVAAAGELGRAGFAVGGAGILADGFLVHGEFLESENGETVDDHPGGFGVPRHARLGGFQLGDEGLVHFLDEIVPLLVEGIDGALGLVDALGAEDVAAGSDSCRGR
jgi:hypothetical protein